MNTVPLEQLNSSQQDMPAAQAVPASAAATETGVGMPSLIVASTLSAVVGIAGGYYLAVRSLTPHLAGLSRVKVVDVPAVAMAGARPGDPDAGKRQAQQLIDQLVASGYIVLPRGGVVDAPLEYQIP